MKYTVKGVEISLNKDEVRYSQRLFNDFLSMLKSASIEADRPTVYYTFLVVSHVMTQDLLDAGDIEMIDTFMKAVSASDVKSNGQLPTAFEPAR